MERAVAVGHYNLIVPLNNKAVEKSSHPKKFMQSVIQYKEQLACIH